MLQTISIILGLLMWICIIHYIMQRIKFKQSNYDEIAIHRTNEHNLSECCGAKVIYHDLCSSCREHI